MPAELALLLIVIAAYALGYGTREFVSWRAQRRFRRSISYYHQDQQPVPLPRPPMSAPMTPAPVLTPPMRDVGPPPPAVAVMPRKQPLKGKISKRGERVYHLPESRYYALSRIDPDKGERYFATVGEAEAAGWRAARL